MFIWCVGVCVHVCVQAHDFAFVQAIIIEIQKSEG